MATPENNKANVSYYVNCSSPAVASNSYKFSVVPVLPNQRGKRIKKQTRSIIFNVYRSIRSQNPKWSMNQVCSRTASLIGVTQRTVWYIKSEYEKNQTRTYPNQNRKKPKVIDTENRVTNRVFRHDDDLLSHIRYTMHEYFFKNERPTSLKLLEVLKRNKKFQTLRKTTLHRLVKEMGFERRPGCSYRIDRDDVILGRRKYLRQINHYRENGRAIYYVGELCMKDDSAAVNIKSSSKESMLLIIHAGSADGFVERALDAFQIVTEKPEWHEIIDSDHVEKWFTAKLFPNIAERSVIVIEHIPRHNAKIETLPNESWKKTQIQEWLSSKSLMWSPDSLKAELLNMVNSVKERFDGYKIDRLAALHNHTILRIPPYHSDLNPIQHAWSEIKNCLAAESGSVEIKDIKKISCEIISAITEKQWKNYIELVKINEAKMWKLDNVLEEWLDARNEPDGSASESE